jgi:preprotein translocase subunit YajC
VASGKITHLKERKKMATTLEIGQTFTTEKSGVVGVIKAVDNHPSGVNRVLLDVNGTERWTSVSN